MLDRIRRISSQCSTERAGRRRTQVPLGRGLLPEIAGIQVQNPGTVAIGIVPGMTPRSAAANLRRVASENRDSRLALKGIAGIRENGDAIRVTLQAWEEPVLVELEPGIMRSRAIS